MLFCGIMKFKPSTQYNQILKDKFMDLVVYGQFTYTQSETELLRTEFKEWVESK